MKITKIILSVIFLFSIFLPATLQAKTTCNVEEGGSCTVGEVEIRYMGIDATGQRKFIIKPVDFGTDPRYLNSPFLTDYIAQVYKYAVTVTTVLATIVIIFAGVLWITSAGNMEQIGRAKKMIARAFTGLLLAVGSYTILWTINPQLVEFGSLKILRVSEVDITETAEEDNATYTGEIAGLKPSWDAQTFKCEERDKAPYNIPVGVADPKTLHTIVACPGEGVIFGGKKLIVTKEMSDAVCRVGAYLNALYGYKLSINSSYRPFDKQVSNWCEKGAKKYPDVNERKKFNAVPGYSNHGHGIAVDVKLLDANNKPLTTIDSKDQCKTDPAAVETLAKAFYATDPKFVRLETEIWHFEYGTAGQSLRGKHAGLPEKCGK